MKLIIKLSNIMAVYKINERERRLANQTNKAFRKKFKKKIKPKKRFEPKLKKQYKDYTEYLNSPEWKAIRKRILKRANHKCEVCKISRAYQVHHKTYKRIFHEKDSDLIAICGICHQDKHKILTEDYIEGRVNDLMKHEGFR
jgi:DNA invertase Pin-like site-specific DNA recombinase